KAKENAETNLKNSKEIFESYLNDVFEKIRKNNSIVKFGSVCNFVRGPFGGSLKKSYFVPVGFAVYEQQHAIKNQFSKIRYFITENKFEEMKRFELKSGDLIMSCSGTMGKIAIVPNNIKKGIINQALLKLTPKNILNINYLKHWMESNDFQNELIKLSKGAAIKNVASVKILKEIKLPLPELKKQEEIITIINNLYIKTKKLEEIYNKKLKSLEELKNSILEKAFKGELTKDIYE
ncbi:MAG: restriction endonuclease subunit S, partial [archaeon]